MSAPEDRRLKMLLRFLYARHNKLVSDDYICRGHIQPSGKKKTLMVRNKKRPNHIRWAKIIRHWATNDNRSFVVLSDECKFILHTNDGSGGCWRIKG